MERFFHRGALALLLAASGWYGAFAATPAAHGWLGPLGFNQVVFVTVMLGSIPLTMLLFLPLRLALGAGRRVVWIKHPAQTMTATLAGAPEAATRKARQRLGELGFIMQGVEETPEGVKLLFTKPKAVKVVRFIDHAFAGEFTARPGSGRVEVSATVIFQDIVVVESGEYDRLAALARYVAGAADDLKVAVLPFTMVCGVVIAAGNLALLPFESLRPWLATQQLTVALAAAGMIVFGGFPILRNRSENYGLGLGGLGLAAALLPLVWH